MGRAGSAASSVLFRCWKGARRCSGKRLGERLHFPILLSKAGQAWSGRSWPQVRAPSCRTCAASEVPENPAKYRRTRIQRWPGMYWLLIKHLRLDSVDVLGFSMGSGTTARLLMLRPPRVKSAILAGVGDYAIEDTVLEFPKSWPIPDYLPRPLTVRVWAEEGAKILEAGEIVPGHLASANLIAARVTGADPKVLAAVIRGRGRARRARGAAPGHRDTGADTQWGNRRRQSKG
jgi:pimeloyl-ACP methyl ester carboxylesterase